MALFQGRGPRIERRVDLDDQRPLLLIHVAYGNPRQGHGSVGQVVVQLAAQRNGKPIDLAGREKGGQGPLAIGGDDRPIAQPGRRDLFQFQVFGNIDPHLIDGSLLSQDLDFAFQGRFGLAQSEQRADFGRHTRLDL